MQEKEQILFQLLKQKIVAVMQQSYPGINPSIEEWKGQEITDFQEDLRIRVNANISEKWFYTHMKTTGRTLPRIDMLNILSRYAGYANWDEFTFGNGGKILIPAQQAELKPKVSANRYFIAVPLGVIAAVAVLFGFFTLFNTREYRFSFIDADTHEPVISNLTEVILLSEGESPLHFLAGADGIYRLKTSKSIIMMVVKSPYYQADTITRTLKKLGNDETIALKADDYALMVHYLSTMKVDDWKKRRERLDAMIGEGAVICQVISGKDRRGMALYNKKEFIDLLSMPSGSLKNIEILSTRIKDEKIVLLRFRINDRDQ